MKGLIFTWNSDWSPFLFKLHLTLQQITQISRTVVFILTVYHWDKCHKNKFTQLHRVQNHSQHILSTNSSCWLLLPSLEWLHFIKPWCCVCAYCVFRWKQGRPWWRGCAPPQPVAWGRCAGSCARWSPWLPLGWLEPGCGSAWECDPCGCI